MQGPRVVDLLIDILDSKDTEVRHAAGEALSGLALDRFKEVAQAIERAISRFPEGSPAIAELPYVLADVPEPGVLKLLGQFLAHRDADAVAAAIEVLVEMGDPSALPMIDKLASDPRRVQLEDAAGTEGQASIGELAIEARALLTESHGHDH
jgi:HEAT repeat protein